jgi:glucose-6-phosphate isomerase, archaeal
LRTTQLAVNFDPGLDVQTTHDPLGFRFGPGVFGPKPEMRSLESIRPSLLDPSCAGPDPVYAIAMDVGKREHTEELKKRMLLFGLVAFAAGRLGREPVRSQGHVHCVSTHSGWRPPELYEIWSGRAMIYMQEFAADDPGRCFAVEAGPGEVVVVPPGWAHAAISRDPAQPLTFAAWCDREYGFEYQQIRARGGLAWHALAGADNRLEWRPNPKYAATQLCLGPPRDYPELGLQAGRSLYSQFESDPSAVQWVSEPGLVEAGWRDFLPCRLLRRLG